MNSVEKVKAVCKERKIPISRLERDLGWGNGYISQLKKGTFPEDRLVAVANYLELPLSFFIGDEAEKPTPIGNEPLSLDYLRTLSAEQLLQIMKDATQALSEK